jgi:ATP-binding cassette, subfamily C, bacterial CydC
VRDFIPYLRLIRDQLTRSLLLGLLLACIAAFAAVGLTGLAGWFITISAIVGVLGITTFSFLFPSAGVQGFALVRTFSRYAERVVNHQATFMWLARLRAMFFEKIIQLPTQRLAGYRSGEVLSRVMSDIDTLDQILLRVLIPTISLIFLSLGCVIVIALFSVPLAMITAVMIIVNGILLPIVAARLGRTPGARFVDMRSQTRTQFIEALQGRREIFSYRAEKTVQNLLTQAISKTDSEQHKMRCLTATGTALNLLLSTSTLLIVLAVGLMYVENKTLTGPNAAMICLIIMGLFEAIEALPLAYQFLGQTRKAVQRLNALSPFEEDSALQNYAAFPVGQPLQLQNVSFRYEGQQHDVLHEVNYSIPQGSFITITGRSGIGKSTLLKLLALEINPSQGRIYVGDTEITAIKQEEFYRHLILVSQDSHLFNTTIRENLLMAKPDATEQEIYRVLGIVSLTNLIAGLDDGLDTKIGEYGYTLSGGEHRRLTIARALLKTPDILLLDEPTSGVDRATADAMMSDIRAWLPQSTIIVVTHDQLLASKAESELRLSATAVSIA